MNAGQLSRQDYVDNACQRLLEKLVRPVRDELDWDIENIGTIREAVMEVLVHKLKLLSEMEFYPFEEEERKNNDSPG